MEISWLTWIIIEMWTLYNLCWSICRWRRSMSDRNINRAPPYHKRNGTTWSQKHANKRATSVQQKCGWWINISGREKETELRQKNDYEVKSKLSRVRARNLLEIEFDLTALWEQRISYKSGTWKSLSESWFWAQFCWVIVYNSFTYCAIVIAWLSSYVLWKSSTCIIQIIPELEY